MKVRYSYLPQQFANCDDLWLQLKEFVKTGDFTLGKPLQEFEENFGIDEKEEESMVSNPPQTNIDFLV